MEHSGTWDVVFNPLDTGFFLFTGPVFDGITKTEEWIFIKFSAYVGYEVKQGTIT